MMSDDFLLHTKKKGGEEFRKQTLTDSLLLHSLDHHLHLDYRYIHHNPPIEQFHPWHPRVYSHITYASDIKASFKLFSSPSLPSLKRTTLPVSIHNDIISQIKQGCIHRIHHHFHRRQFQKLIWSHVLEVVFRKSCIQSSQKIKKCLSRCCFC